MCPLLSRGFRAVSRAYQVTTVHRAAGRGVGSFHAGRQTYLIEACEKNMLGLIDAASLKDEGNDRAS